MPKFLANYFNAKTSVINFLAIIKKYLINTLFSCYFSFIYVFFLLNIEDELLTKLCYEQKELTKIVANDASFPVFNCQCINYSK